MSTGKTKIEEKGRAASAFLQGERRKALASAKIASGFSGGAFPRYLLIDKNFSAACRKTQNAV